MKYYKNFPIKKLSWNSSGSGNAENYYLPETIDEFIDLIKSLKKNNKKYDLIGHTSNLLFSDGYNPEYLIGTRLLNKYEIKDNIVVCECGVKISLLSNQMLSEGYKGYEGLIDLPGTVGSAIYGNAGCYNCGMDSLVEEIEFLTDDLEIIKLTNQDLCFSQRSSAIKRKEFKGVILRAYLKKEQGNYSELKHLSEVYRAKRRATQPGPAKNLGSIFSSLGEKTSLYLFLKVVARIFIYITNPLIDKKNRFVKENIFIIKLLGHKEVIPYIKWGINRYIWLDNDSYIIFYSYLKLVNKIYKNPKLEIEIR